MASQKNKNLPSISRVLDCFDACSPGKEWSRQYTSWKKMWKECDRVDWMVWFLEEINLDYHWTTMALVWCLWDIRDIIQEHNRHQYKRSLMELCRFARKETEETNKGPWYDRFAPNDEVFLVVPSEENLSRYFLPTKNRVKKETEEINNEVFLVDYSRLGRPLTDLEHFFANLSDVLYDPLDTEQLYNSIFKLTSPNKYEKRFCNKRLADLHRSNPLEYGKGSLA
jgi:hypothetical protein